MSGYEDMRFQLRASLAQHIGDEPAARLMEALPPYNWTDIVTKNDLKAEMADVRAEMKAEFAIVRQEMGGSACRNALAHANSAHSDDHHLQHHQRVDGRGSTVRSLISAPH